MFSNQNFQLPVIILLIGVYGVLSLNGFSSDQVAQWKVDFVIEKAPSKQLIEYRKEQINNEVIKKPNASKEEDTKSDEKFLEGFIEKIKALREKVEDEVIPLITNKKGGKKNGDSKKNINSPVLVEISISGEVIEINNEYLSLLPSIGKNDLINIPVKRITSVTRTNGLNETDESQPGKKDFRVLLRDGSEIIGEPSRLDQEALILSIKNTELILPLPIDEIIRIDRELVSEDGRDYSFPEFSKSHVAFLSTGEIISGQLLPSLDSDRWLRLSSPILSSEIPLSLVDSLIFPSTGEILEEVEKELAQDVKIEQDGNNKIPEDNTVIEEEDEVEFEEVEPRIRNLVSLSPVGMLWTDKIEMSNGEVVLSALGKDNIRIPFNAVESFSFGQEGLPSSAPVLVWGGYSDDDDEYVKTVNSLAGRIPERKLIRSFAKVPDPEFVRTLKRSRVLLVPEMEGFRRTKMKEFMAQEGRGCPSWQEIMRGHLKRGGNIIFLSPTGEALSFLSECGFGSIRSGPGAAGWQLTKEAKKTRIKLDGFIKNVNASHYYRRSDSWEVWGEAQGVADSAILLGRKVERGWVMIFGSDFYQQNETIKEILHSLIKFTGR